MEGGDKVTDDHMLLPQVEDKRVHAFMSLHRISSSHSATSDVPYNLLLLMKDRMHELVIFHLISSPCHHVDLSCQEESNQ